MNLLKKNIFYALIALLAFTTGSGLVLADEADSPNHKSGKHYTCIHFVDDYTGKDIRNSCAPQGTSGSKSYTHTKTEFTNKGSVYKLLGWYDAEDNLVSDSTNKAKIKVSYTASNEKCEDLYYYLKWEEEKAPVLIFNYIDNISTGTGSWTNSDGNTKTYTHTFKKPEQQPHFNFIHWIIENNIFNPGESFTYDFSQKLRNTSETINAYALWQPSITLNLFDDETLLKTTEDFEKVSIDGYIPEKEGKTFNNWIDEDGNIVEEDTFSPEEATIEKVTPKVVNLYATWIDNKNNKDNTTTTPKNTEKSKKKTTKTITSNKYPATIVPPKTGI